MKHFETVFSQRCNAKIHKFILLQILETFVVRNKKYERYYMYLSHLIKLIKTWENVIIKKRFWSRRNHPNPLTLYFLRDIYSWDKYVGETVNLWPKVLVLFQRVISCFRNAISVSVVNESCFCCHQQQMYCNWNRFIMSTFFHSL